MLFNTSTIENEIAFKASISCLQLAETLFMVAKSIKALLFLIKSSNSYLALILPDKRIDTSINISCNCSIFISF